MGGGRRGSLTMLEGFFARRSSPEGEGDGGKARVPVRRCPVEEVFASCSLFEQIACYLPLPVTLSLAQ